MGICSIIFERAVNLMSASQAPPPRRTTPPPPPPPPPRSTAPTETQIRRFKLAWRLFMIANLGLGAYMFATATIKSTSTKSERPPLKKGRASRTPTPPTEELLEEREFMPSIPIANLVKEREPVPDAQQRELFEWILDEKRKIKPTSKAEKKQIDEEKAILKRFIRAESVPRF